MNRGTKQGDKQEIKFVTDFNKNKVGYKDFILSFSKNIDKIWMCRVTTKQLSKLSNQRVFTRSDCYLIESSDPQLAKVLKDNDNYLSEDILNNNKIKFIQIEKSGISIKMVDSNNFQILKLQPDSFYNLFSNYELGAGASIYCLKENELIKNDSVLKGWKTTISNMMSYFKELKLDKNFINDLAVCKKIKEYSNKKIKELIDNSKELQKKIFNGYQLYEEPYVAWYLYHGDNIEKLTYIPFTVTTGSGRSHGDFTVVLKPI